MKRTRHSTKQIVNTLREADAMHAAGRNIAQIVQAIGVSEPTYARWRSQYGGMKADEARRLKELELENARLKRLVADQAIDISILKEANDYLGKHRALWDGVVDRPVHVTGRAPAHPLRQRPGVHRGNDPTADPLPRMPSTWSASPCSRCMRCTSSSSRTCPIWLSDQG
ncbi:MAG: transposase [Phycisphaeraceae bacterium]|nr:transposase [Phycisphaeraceae bacterium]